MLHCVGAELTHQLVRWTTLNPVAIGGTTDMPRSPTASRSDANDPSPTPRKMGTDPYSSGCKFLI
jgi:hypothetical protein